MFAQSNLLGAEGVPALVAGLVALERHPYDAGVHEAAKMALKILARNNAANQKAIASARQSCSYELVW